MTKAKKVVSEEVVKDPVEGLEAPVTSEEPKEEKTKKAKKTSFDVYNPGGSLVRTFSVERHGKEAEDLATEYAKKISGEVK